GADLQAILLDDFSGIGLDDFEHGELRLVSPVAAVGRTSGSLLDLVDCPHDLSPWLANVRPVESLEEALAERMSLAEGESLISRDGFWVGRRFLRVRRAGEAESGML